MFKIPVQDLLRQNNSWKFFLKYSGFTCTWTAVVGNWQTKTKLHHIVKAHQLMALTYLKPLLPSKQHFAFVHAYVKTYTMLIKELGGKHRHCPAHQSCISHYSVGVCFMHGIQWMPSYLRFGQLNLVKPYLSIILHVIWNQILISVH